MEINSPGALPGTISVSFELVYGVTLLPPPSPPKDVCPNPGPSNVASVD